MADNMRAALGSGQRMGRFPLEECEGWELLRRHLELAEGFSFAVITAPDDWGVAHLREEFPALLPSPEAWSHLVFDPSQPPESLAELLLSLPIPPPATKVLWLDAEPGTPDELPNRDAAWGHALARLNRYRNTLTTRLPCALLLAIPVRILPILRASAPDLWAIRSGLFRIEPPGITNTNFEWIEPRGTAPQKVSGDHQQTLAEADKLRGKPGRELLLASLLHRAGRQAHSSLKWREAEKALQEAYTLLQNYGADPQERVKLALTLGSLFEDEANFERSEFYQRRALAEADQHLGKNHPLTAVALNDLAQLLQTTNRLAEAEPLLRRALEIDEQSFGSNHPNVAIHLNNLAQLLQATNRLAEAEPLMRRALEIDERSFGSNHPKVATDLNNLAQLLKATNRLAEAEPLMRGALEIILRSQNRCGHPLREVQIVSANYSALLFNMQWSREQVDEQIEKLTLDCKQAIEEEHR
jgi:tetratricopeptide (TPR) repeat protein